uniref:Arsenite-resistance protein 2 n=1 Tax=Tetraselmis sp. GSL018 TaxID=582737 RepID=A0A061R2X8_9CHLO
MSGRDRRRSPRRDDRRDRDRRRRSFSPPRGGRRRSPPPRGRLRDDEFFDRVYGGRFEEDHRRGRRSLDRDHGGEPMSYKEFIRQLDDHITPMDADRAYQDYLADFWGSEQRRDFETKKDERWVRAKYDPREIQTLKGQRAARAAESARELLSELAEGKLDPEADGFNQGEGPDSPSPPPVQVEAAEEKGDAEMAEARSGDAAADENGGGDSDAKPAEETAAAEAAAQPAAQLDPAEWAPPAAWDDQRMQEDIALSQQLIRKLDEENGIRKNPLLPAEAPAEADSEEAAQEAEAKDESAEDELPSVAIPSRPESHLDVLLTYLWRVHGIDYYGGQEHVVELLPEDTERPKHRKLRGPRPAKDSEEPKEPSVQEFGQQIDGFWRPRLESGGPFEKLLRSKEVEERLNEWIESQVTKIEENKWGCRLSTKLFVGKEYVLKHIKGKHAHVVETERERILDDIYMKNFMDGEEQRAASEAPIPAHEPGMPVGHRPGPPGFFGPGNPGPMGRMNRHPRGGRGPMGGHMGRGPMRGGYNGGRGGGDGGMIMGPMTGQVLVPAPGAGPLGPFIMAPGPVGPPMGMAMAPPMQGQAVRQYHDLDAPKNNRAVLDYGDL